MIKGPACLLFFLISSILVSAQTAYILGEVKDKKGSPIEFVNVGLREAPGNGDVTDREGRFFLQIEGDRKWTLVISYVGYRPVQMPVSVEPGDTLKLNIRIRRSAENLPVIEIKPQGERSKSSTFTLDPKEVSRIPTPSGNFEALLKTIGLGVSTAGGELSSQYSVRGGNFDENLVYVNDFEIYRPQLIRSGQQEGLSFVNPDLTRKIEFSSGGFEARYGDKMSSVLDVQYKRPDSFAASIQLSLLGAQGHLEGADRYKRFRYLIGLRQKSNQYLLSGLTTQGSYRPSFSDAQAMLIYTLNENWEMEFIGNYARNSYIFVPESRVSSIGTFNDVKELEVFFDGQEEDRFETGFGGLSFTYAADSNRFRLKFLASAFRTQESETFDIIGDYFLYQVENDLGAKDFGNRLFSLGYGTYQNWARNYLTMNVANAGARGYLFSEKHLIEFGARAQYEKVDDRLNEWKRIDSALYSLPRLPGKVMVREVLKTQNKLQSQRYSVYFQDTWILAADSCRGDLNLTSGVRGSYWTVNGEFLISPRFQLSWKPVWERNMVFRFSTGLYQQAPFYREIRDLDGNIHRDVRAQKSFHAVLGSDYVFEMWDREFRFISELYYKYLWDLVPYNIEDVKIRYFGENLSKGYAAGIDLRLHGEFVKDAESWVTLGLMQTREDIEGDSYTKYVDANGQEIFTFQSDFSSRVSDTVTADIGYIARPTDQRVNVGILFQDYFPNNKNFKVHLNLLFGTGLPFGPPENERYRNAFRMPPYRRVDIGFSALLLDKGKRLPGKSGWKEFESIWASLEVFNLLGINNTVSHIWIKDNTNTSYAFENYLTGRRLNLRLIARF